MPGFSGGEEGRPGAIHQRLQRVQHAAIGDDHGAAGPECDFGRGELGDHAALGVGAGFIPGHGLDFRRDPASDQRQVFGSPTGLGVAGVEPVDIGEQHQQVGPDHAAHAGRKPVVITEADFCRRHRIVFVDQRHRPPVEQAVERRACIEVAAAVFRVFLGQQDLADVEVALGKAVRVGLGQPDLPQRSGSLLFVQPQVQRVPVLQAQADPDRARGDQHHPPPGLDQPGEVVDQRRHPLPADRTVVVDQQRGADLDHHRRGLGHGLLRRGHAAQGVHGSGSLSPSAARRSAARWLSAMLASSCRIGSTPSPLTADMIQTFFPPAASDSSRA